MKLIIYIVSIMRRIYWAIFRPTTVGVRAIVVNKEQEILLVKHRYTKNWYLPGGGVKKGESLTIAMRRELKEEVAINEFESMELLGTYANFFESKSDYISVFIIYNHLPASKTGDPEIEQCKFFQLKDLPFDTSPGSKKRILEFLGEKTIDFEW